MTIRESFNEEFGYLCKKHFSDLKIEPYYTYSNILLYINGIPYDYYRMNNNMEVMIPSYDDVLLDGDFEDIYIIQATEPFDFTFRIINKKDGIVKTRDYNYHNHGGKTNTSYAYNEMDDFNNDFKRLYEESGLPIEQFVIKNYFEKLENTNEIICSSVMTKDDLKYYVTSFTNFEDCIDEIQDAHDKNKFSKTIKKQLLMEMNEQLSRDKINNKTKKIK